MHLCATNKQHVITMGNNTQTRLVVIMFLLPSIWQFNVIQNQIRNEEDQIKDDGNNNNARTRNNQYN